MSLRLHGGEELLHRDRACSAGFTVVLEAEPPSWYDSGERTEVEVRCFSCDTRYVFTAGTRAVMDPETERYQPPAEHAPRLYVSSMTCHGLAAARPAERHGQVLLQPEVLFQGGDVMRWWVTDVDGNVLGEVAWYLTARGAHRYRWGSLEDVAGHGDGCKTPGAAARALGAAAGVGRALAATG